MTVKTIIEKPDCQRPGCRNSARLEFTAKHSSEGELTACSAACRADLAQYGTRNMPFNRLRDLGAHRGG